MTTPREQLSAKEIARIRISEIEVKMRKLTEVHSKIPYRDYDRRFDELLTIKRLSQAILYDNKELADSNEIH